MKLYVIMVGATKYFYDSEIARSYAWELMKINDPVAAEQAQFCSVAIM